MFQEVGRLWIENMMIKIGILILIVVFLIIGLFIIDITIQSPGENIRELTFRAEKGDVQAQRFLAEQYDPRLHRPERNRLFWAKNQELSQYWYKKLCDGNDNNACKKLDASAQGSPKRSEPAP